MTAYKAFQCNWLYANYPLIKKYIINMLICNSICIYNNDPNNN